MTVVEWLEAEFDRRHAELTELVDECGSRLHRPMFELLPQDDGASGASWPDPAFGTDLDLDQVAA